MPSEPKLTLYTKPACHLCDEFKDLLSSLKNEFTFEVLEVNIETSEELFKNFKEKIPVLLVNGKMFAKYTLDKARLRKKLLELKCVVCF